MSENLAYLHQNTSSHIKLQHDFNYYKEKSQTEKKLGEKQSFLAKMRKFHPMHHAPIPVCHATLEPILEAFLCTKFAPSGLVGMVYLSTLHNK